MEGLGDLQYEDLPESDVRVAVQTKELNNGRLAMIAIAAFVVQVRLLPQVHPCSTLVTDIGLSPQTLCSHGSHIPIGLGRSVLIAESAG